MTTPIRFLILVSILVAVGAALMVPRSNEWLAMLRDEDKQAQIISLLEPRLARGDNDPAVLVALGTAYANTGNYPRAAELLKRYVALRPDDDGAFGILADVYGNQQDTSSQIAALQRSIAIKPVLSRIAQLGDVYGKQQRTDEERTLLSSHERQLTLQSGLVLRLAQLRADSGDREGAIQLLMRDDVTSAAQSPVSVQNERLLLAELLADTGRGTEAVRLGRQWILQWHQPWLAGRLLRGVAPRARETDASELADAVATLHPEIRLFLVHDLVEAGARPVATHLLETWSIANPSASRNEIAAFISACRELDQQNIVWQSFAQVLNHSSPDQQIIRFSEAIGTEFGIEALLPFWSQLPLQATEEKSLLPARLAFSGHDLPMTRSLLQKVELTALDASERQMWMDLLTASASPEQALEILRGRVSQLPPDLLVQYARLAGELGHESDYRAAMAALGKSID